MPRISVQQEASPSPLAGQFKLQIMDSTGFPAAATNAKLNLAKIDENSSQRNSLLPPVPKVGHKYFPTSHDSAMNGFLNASLENAESASQTAGPFVERS